MADEKQASAAYLAGTQTSLISINKVVVKKEIPTKGGGFETVDFNITSNIVNIVIRESLMSMVLEGSVIFEDRNNFIQLSPMVGDEFVTFDISSIVGTTPFVFTETFSVTRSTFQKQTPNDPAGVVSLEFRSSFSKKFFTEYSTSFSEKPIGEFIKTFFTNVMGVPEKRISVTPTAGNFTFAFPYQNINTTINYLTNYAKSKDGDGGYFLFSSLFNGFTYSPITALFKGKPHYTLTEEAPDPAQASPALFASYKPVDFVDSEYFLGNHAFGTTNIRFDFDKKSTVEEEFTLSKVIGDMNLTYKFPYVSMKDASPQNFHYYQHDPKSFVWKNYMLGHYLEKAPVIVMTQKGMLERATGQLAELKFAERATETLPNDPVRDGKYLIVDIKHTITLNNYNQAVTYARLGNTTQMSKAQDFKVK